MTKRELDEITATRQFFQEYNSYTKLPDESPSWIAFWEEERRRCLEGYHFGSDYISGYFYNYLNFCPIYLTEVTNETDDRASGIRKIEFPDYWDGHYKVSHYINEAELAGEHAFWGGSRGKSKSFFAASMLNRNYFHIEGSTNFAIASDLTYLLGDGIITKSFEMMDFIDTNTAWAKRRQVRDDKLHRRASKKVTGASGVMSEVGWKSEIQGVTVGDDYNKMRGKRGKLMVLEESGNFKDLDKLHQTLRPGMEDGNVTFGLILHIGTGGTEGASSTGFHELMKNPRAYRIHPVKNTTDPGMENSENGFFFPANWNYKGAYDKLGNSDIVRANMLIDKELEIVKKAGDPHAVVRRTAELPRTVGEMLMRISGTQFPVMELKQQEGEIEVKPHIYRNAEFHVIFELDKDTQKYTWKADPDPRPIYSYPNFDNKNLPGCFIIYEHPKTNEKEEVFEGRYIAGIDSFDFDESTTTSLGSLFIMDSWTGRIVAEYTGRPKAFEFYEKCRRGLLYYNARVNIENANKGIFDYFDSKGSGYLITDELRIAREATNESTHSTRKRGTTPSKPLNAYARGLGAQYLLETTSNPDKPEEINVHKLRCLPLIKEMILWNSEGNFDRVSAFGMLMLLYYEKKKYMVDGTYQLGKSSINEDPYLQKIFKNYNKTFGRY